jgi:riboflavin kinase/FMN adenylyltransferase
MEIFHIALSDISGGEAQFTIQGSAPLPQNCCVALGKFDGIHLGHQKLLQQCIKAAKTHNTHSAAITFWPHPEAAFLNNFGQNSQSSYRYITTQEEKISLLNEIGIDYLIILQFDKNLTKMTADEFINRFLVNYMHVAAVFTGENFRFGHKKMGSAELLAEYASRGAFAYQAIENVTMDYYEVSSTYIKQLLSFGAMGVASLLLNRPYTLKGQLGASQLTVPHSVPIDGVYLSRYILQNIWHYVVAEVHDHKINIAHLNAPPSLAQPDIELQILHLLRPYRNIEDAEARERQQQKDLRIAKYAQGNIKLGEVYA